MRNPVSRKLYLRIWLAIVGSILILSLILAWAWHRYEQERELERQEQLPRTVTLYDGSTGQTLVGQGSVRWSRETGTDFSITLPDARTLDLHMAPQPRRHSGLSALMWRLRPPFGFLWIIGLAGLAVMLGVFPLARRLTGRLEKLQHGVQRWGEGHLDQRVAVTGADEISDLAHHFNQAADRIAELMREQAQLVQSQKSLLANASHELRSPLARIRMALELSGDTQDAHGMRDEISRNVIELDELVEEILLASRLDEPRASLGPTEAVDLVGLLVEECARVDAELSLPPNMQELRVQGVAKLLRRAARNLLENAVRYGGGPQHSQPIRARLTVDDRMAQISVIDRGPGVPPDQRERIFEPFYRLPGASEHDGGVGLGLALVRSIARHHGGSVYCTQAPEGGARFVLNLPLSA